MLQISDSANGVLFATGELVYEQGMGNKLLSCFQVFRRCKESPMGRTLGILLLAII